MPSPTDSQRAFHPQILEQLACPACLGGLRMEEARLVCAECGRGYPIVDGIPVLIAGRDEKSIQSV